MKNDHCPDCGTSLNFSTLSEFADLQRENGFTPTRIGSEVVVLAGDVEVGEEFTLTYGRIYSMNSATYCYMTQEGKLFAVPSNRVVTLRRD